MSDSWLRFWDRPNSIYANERHRAVHYARLADDILATLPERPGLTVLDYGCGEARDAGRVAARVGRLLLYDAAPSTRDRLAAAAGDDPGIAVLDDPGLAALPAGSVDAIVVCSVLQYVDRDALPGLLDTLRRLLKADGLLILADVIPPECGLADDVRALLTAGARHGFLVAALAGLATTLFSDYRRVRSRLGLSVYADGEFRAILANAGLDVALHDRNFGFNPARRTYLARPRQGRGTSPPGS